MTITKSQLQSVVKKAYSLGYNDCANQSGYNIAVQQKLVIRGEIDGLNI